MRPTRYGQVLPYLLFVLSGAAALILEAVFLRRLALLFGNTATATALVLAAFMTGLALGAAFFGRVADRIARPLRLFATLELGTALSSAALAWLLGEGRQEFLAPVRWFEPGPARNAFELALAFLLLLLPTILMGGTLPALSRHVIRRMDRFAGSLGLLYGLDTLGAAAGAFAAGFYLFEDAGIAGSALVAVFLQVSVGLVALALDRVTTPAGPSAGTPAGPPADATPGAAPRACLVAAGAGGLVVLGYEVVWTRLLSLPMRSFSYSFSLMLSLFLLGLCLGAVLTRWVAPHVGSTVRWIGALQLSMGLYVAGSVLWMPKLLSPVGSSSFEDFLARSTLRSGLIVLPPTILSGLVLPLAGRGYARGVGRVAGDIGVVYSLNTAGAIVGSLLAGLVLLPDIGAPRALALLAMLNAAIGASLVLFARRGGRAWPGRAALALAMLTVVPLFAAGTDRYVRAFLDASRGASSIGELIFFHEGATDTVAIVRKDYGFHDPEAKSLITNGIAMSATVKPVWRYMSLEGHLPVLLAPGARRALAVGVGTGITLSAVVSHPELERIVAVELSEGVARGLAYFEHENGLAYRDPRVELIRGDGRHFLELTDERFDVITVEPPPPIVAGSVNLYSLDFYRLCLSRLEPGGVLAQWLPLHAQSLASARMTASTFLEAFPHAMLWLPSVRDAVLVGAREPLGTELTGLLAALRVPSVRASLDAAYPESPEALLGAYLLGREGIRRWADGAPVVTDDRPLMEFFRHQGGNMSDADTGTLLALPQDGWGWLRGIVDDPALLERVRLENRALRTYVGAAVSGDPNRRVEAARQSSGTEFFLYGLGCASEQLRYLRESPGVSRPEAELHAQRCEELRASP